MESPLGLSRLPDVRACARGGRHLLRDIWAVHCRADDVQVEFVMLDPYVRITLSHDNQVMAPRGPV